MSWLIVAKKDFQDASRSRLLGGLTVLFVFVVGGLAYSSTITPTPDPGKDYFSSFIFFLRHIAAFFISITAVMIAYRAVADERETGTISLLLGLPHTRRDVVLGKVVGRGAVLSVALLSGFGVAAVILGALGGPFDADQFLLFTLVSLFYGLAFVSVTVALSAVTARASRAAVAGIGFWVLDQFWEVPMKVGLYVANGFANPEPPFPDWYHALVGLGPGWAYRNAAGYFLPARAAELVQRELGDLPEWYGLVVLAGWLVVPLVLGIVRFQRSDL